MEERPCFYEQWGAPVLLYRQRSTFTQQDDQTRPNHAKQFLEDEAQLRRAIARWYYQHEIPFRTDEERQENDALMYVSNCFEDAQKLSLFRQARQKLRDEKDAAGDNAEEVENGSDWSNDDGCENEEEDAEPDEPKKRKVKKRKSKLEVIMQDRWKREADLTKQLLNPRIMDANIDPSVQLDRAEMLLAGQDQDDDTGDLSKKTLLLLSQFDSNYIPLLQVFRGLPGFRATDSEQNRLYDRERLNRGDPAYLAPFHRETVKKLADEVTDRHLFNMHRKLERLHDPNPPAAHGNCLLSFPCRCGYCEKEGNEPTPCLLHPIGPLLNSLRLSFCWLLRNQMIAHRTYPPPPKKVGLRQLSKTIQVDLDIGDRILQITRCGEELLFVVRTTCFLTMVRINYDESKKGKGCWAGAYIERIHCWDHRTLSPSALSFQPVSIASHPRYGKFTPCNIVAAYRASNGRQNCLHHIHATESSDRVEQHVIQNLCEISQIEFSASHHMLLWSAARSFVRPLLCDDKSRKWSAPRLGYGTALYNIDLRCSQKASFQWSPSGEEFFQEGVHTISGISTDWSSSHRLWVSSISASRTWELDDRMPCHCVAAYSLAHYADQQPAVQAMAEASGSGAIFSYPWSNATSAATNVHPPVLCLGKSPRTFGIHMYHRPDIPSKFCIPPVECFSGPKTDNMEDLSIARSTVYPLPDSSDSTFPIGLTSFHLSVEAFCPKKEIEDMGCDAENMVDPLCVISLNSKGDVYLHTLLGSTASSRVGDYAPEQQGGASVIAVPEAIRKRKPKKGISWNALVLGPCNDIPVQESAVDHLSAIATNNFIDLEHFEGTKQANPRGPSSELSNFHSYSLESGAGQCHTSLCDGVIRSRKKTTREGPTQLSLKVRRRAHRPPSKFMDEQKPEAELAAFTMMDQSRRSDLDHSVLGKAWKEPEATQDDAEESYQSHFI